MRKLFKKGRKGQKFCSRNFSHFSCWEFFSWLFSEFIDVCCFLEDSLKAIWHLNWATEYHTVGKSPPKFQFCSVTPNCCRDFQLIMNRSVECRCQSCQESNFLQCVVTCYPSSFDKWCDHQQQGIEDSFKVTLDLKTQNSFT